MNFLIDTNIIIPLEPCSITDTSINIEQAIEFCKLINKSDNLLFIHPAISYDLKRDKNRERAKLRNSLLGKYEKLISPPDVNKLKTIGNPKYGSNDWVDNSLLAAVDFNAVDCLVTEDKGIHKKAKRLNISDRVYFLEEAITLFKDMFDKEPFSHPNVMDVFLHEVDINNQIFNSLKKDYNGFVEWFKECQRQHRKAYIIKNNNEKIAGICIKKQEKELPNGIKGKVLKLCTFKISEEYKGNRYGELLFKIIFEYVKENNYQFIYFTVFPKQELLINFTKDFGFYKMESDTNSKELVLVKNFNYTKNDYKNLSAFQFHKKFGPSVISFNNNSSFIIPIQPQYHKILFPETENWLIPPNFSCGNGLKKAYLSNSQTLQLKKGDNIFFYRSQDIKGITVAAIIEDTFKSQDTNKIASYVGKRTVYKYTDIKKLCSVNSVLAIKFRLVSILKEKIPGDLLISKGIINGVPQTITLIKKEQVKCLQKIIKI